MNNVIDDKTFLKRFGQLEDVMNHLKFNIKTKLGVSDIHGVGVFSIKDIKKGEDVFPDWEHESGIYIIPNDRLSELSSEVLELLDMYFINSECGYKVIRLFKGLNFLSNAFSFCNSSHNTYLSQNIDFNGIAIRDIKKGEEILEFYTKNIYK